MPSQPTQNRLNKLIPWFTGAVNIIELLAEAFETPFLKAISKTSQSLLTAVQAVKQNRGDCAELMEQTHGLLYAIVSLHTKSKTGPELPPSTLSHIGKFMETLHKIHTYVEAQQDRSQIWQFFRKGEMKTLLKACQTGLQEAREEFEVQNISLLTEIADIKTYEEERHQEVLQIIENLSDASNSDTASSRMFSTLHNSSTSISMLPSEPKIFHGRESELADIINLFEKKYPRIAILGPGGMGKTSLAKAVLHHPQILARFNQHRYFVACDSVSTKAELVPLIGAHLGLKPGKDLTRPISQFLSSNPGCLLILDNLETVWDPIESRQDVEEFLSLLTDVEHMALLITMRGAERPAKICWTHPIILQLKPLGPAAARQTFIDITDDEHNLREIDQILLLTDNMPLAISLLAHLADSEGCLSVLSRWEMETTSIISAGYDKQSNLDLSISLSLTSTRIKSSHDSQELLSLLSMLPEGLTDIDLLQSKLPLENILSCKSALVATSLAYTDEHKHLKALVPVREYMKKLHPPKAHIVESLRDHFQQLLEFYNKYDGHSGIHSRISSNFANIQNVLQSGLHCANSKLVNNIYCICYLSNFSYRLNRGYLSLLEQVPRVLSLCCDHTLEVYFITTLLASSERHLIPNMTLLIGQALEHLPNVDDGDVKCRFYNAVGSYFRFHKNDIPTAMNYYQTALSLAISTGNIKRQSFIRSDLGWVKWQLGDSSAGQMHAYEARRLSKICGDLVGEASALNAEANCWYALGNYKHALFLCSRGRDLLTLCGLTGGPVDDTLKSSQAEIHMLKSEYSEAHHIYQQRLDDSVDSSQYSHAMTLLNIALFAVPMGLSKELVQSHIDKAKPIFTTLGMPRLVVCCDTARADLNLREGNTIEANTQFQECLKISWCQDAEIEAYCLERLADGNHWYSTYWKRSWATVYLAHSIKRKQNLDIHKSLQFLGDQYLSEGDQDTAISLYTVALEGFTQMDVHRNRAECMLRLGNIAELHGDSSKAMELWTTARPLFERSSQKKQVSLVDTKLADNCEPTETFLNSVELGTSTAVELTKLAATNVPGGETEDQSPKHAEDSVTVLI